MNNNRTFGTIYVTAIAITLITSLYGNHLNPTWNHAVFTFPPDTQQVVINGTAVMEVSWRWLPETLEIVVKVNDDESSNKTFPTTYKNRTLHNRKPDALCFLFDSDNNGYLSTGWKPFNWSSEDDHCVGIGTIPDSLTNHTSGVGGHYWLDEHGIIYGPLLSGLSTIAYLDNSSSWTFKEGEGYNFKLSVPTEFINVTSPTTVYINFWDGYCEMSLEFGEGRPYEEARLLSVLVAELEM